MAATRAWRAFVVLAAGLVLVTAGCDSSSGNEATPTKEPVKLFVPCDGISDDAVRAAGADPATEQKDIAGVHQTGFEICSWRAPWYFVNVYSTVNTVGEVQNNPDNARFRDVDVSGRKAIEYHKVTDQRVEGCELAFEAKQGAILVTVDKMSTQPNPEDPCVTVARAAGAILADLPN